MTNVTLPVVRNPALNKLQSGYTAGTLLTINGSGFGTRTNGQALYFSSGQQLTGDSYCSRLTSTRYYNTTVATSTTYGNSVVIDLAQGSLHPYVFGTPIPFTPTKPLITYVERYYDYDVMNPANLDTPFDVANPNTYAFNLKHFRLWSADATHDIYTGGAACGYNGNPPNGWTNAQGLPPSVSGTPTGYMFVENVSGNSAIYYPSSTPASQWLNEEYIFKNSSASGVKDGQLRHYRNGAWLNSSNYLLTTIDSTYTQGLSNAYLDEISNNTRADIYFNTYYRHVLYDDEVRGLYLGNASTLSACTKLVRQATASWSDTKITYRAVNNFSCAYYYIRTDFDTWLSTNGVAL